MKNDKIATMLFWTCQGIFGFSRYVSLVKYFSECKSIKNHTLGIFGP